MKTRPRMKCKTCGHWNRIEAEKIDELFKRKKAYRDFETQLGII